MSSPNSRSFTIKSTKGIARVLATKVLIRDPNSSKESNIVAIWDTGATGSVVTSKVIDELGIRHLPTGFADIHTANGLVKRNTYTVNIVLPNNVTIRNVLVSECDSLSGGCDALIGMDIITTGDLSITNFNGVTCMSFRFPSCHEVDFVKNPHHGTKAHIAPGKPGSNFTLKKKKR